MSYKIAVLCCFAMVLLLVGCKTPPDGSVLSRSGDIIPQQNSFTSEPIVVPVTPQQNNNSIPEPTPGTTQHRIALVIGNNAYKNTNPLHNAVTDARTMRDVLAARNFEVLYHENVDRVAMHDAFDDFINRLTANTVGMVFYAGHGVQIKDTNYLLPVDIKVNNERDVQRDGVDLGKTLDFMGKSNTAFSLAVIDACRNNPFKIPGTTRSVGGSKGGLAAQAARGLMVVYAAGVNQEAVDRLGENDPNPNGLFTREFVQALSVPGLTVQEVVSKARLAVHAKASAVGRVQMPALYDEAVGTFVFTAANVPDVPNVPNVPDSIPTREPDPVPIPDPKPIDNGRGVVISEKQPEHCVDSTTADKNGKLALEFAPELVIIPAGCSMMGNARSETTPECNQSQQHKVCVNAFKISKYEITVKQYLACVEAKGCSLPHWQEVGSEYNTTTGSNEYYKNLGHALMGDNHPIVGVSWRDAVAYTQWLSNQTGKTYRLPTEAEWEYAARAGTTTAYWWGDDASYDHANHGQGVCCGTLVRGKDKWEYTAPVGSFAANPWGLYDTAGNVWEWTCSEFSQPYSGEENTNVMETTCKSQVDAGDLLVLRGGSWHYAARWLKSASRLYYSADSRMHDTGLRVVQNCPGTNQVKP